MIDISVSAELIWKINNKQDHYSYSLIGKQLGSVHILHNHVRDGQGIDNLDHARKVPDYLICHICVHSKNALI